MAATALSQPHSIVFSSPPSPIHLDLNFPPITHASCLKYYSAYYGGKNESDLQAATTLVKCFEMAILSQPAGMLLLIFSNVLARSSIHLIDPIARLPTSPFFHPCFAPRLLLRQPADPVSRDGGMSEVGPHL